MARMRSLVSLRKTVKTSSRPSGVMARRRRSKMSGSRTASSFGDLRGVGGCDRASGKGGAEALRREGFFEDGVVAVELRRGRGAHREKQSPRRGFAQGAGEIGAVETRHAEVGEDAVGGIGPGEIEGLSAAFGLENDAAFGFQQDRRDRKTHRVVVDGEDAAWDGGRPGIHVGDDFTHGL